jgi:hypothetical protein
MEAAKSLAGAEGHSTVPWMWKQRYRAELERLGTFFSKFRGDVGHGTDEGFVGDGTEAS